MFTLSCLIVASRKHYTVDVFIAWYAVPLVFYALNRYGTQHRRGSCRMECVEGLHEAYIAAVLLVFLRAEHIDTPCSW